MPHDWLENHPDVVVCAEGGAYKGHFEGTSFTHIDFKARKTPYAISAYGEHKQ